MKKEIREVLGFQTPMLTYESFEEADKAAGKPGAGLVEMNNNLLYRGTYADARSLIVDVVQELTKVDFIMKDTGEKDEKGAPILERDTQKDSDAKYVERALAKVPTVSRDQVQAIVSKRAEGYTYTDNGQTIVVPPLAADITQRERKPPKPPKLSEEDRAIATELLDGKKDLKKFTSASAKYNIAPFVATKDRVKDIEALGWLVRGYFKAKSDEAKAKAKTDF